MRVVPLTWPLLISAVLSGVRVGLAMDVDVNGLSRKSALDRVLSFTEVAVEWQDQSVSSVPIYGVRSGSQDELIRSILAGTSFAIFYQSDGKTVAKIVVGVSNNGSMPSSTASHKTTASVASTPARDKSTIEYQGIGERQHFVRKAFRKRALQTLRAYRRRLAVLPPGVRPMSDKLIHTMFSR